MIFDVLSLDGRSLLGVPYTERRAELEALNLHGAPFAYPRNLR
jgi:bifunctional non-homologous end joining protein LigD